jgi:hypothetical protein
VTVGYPEVKTWELCEWEALVFDKADEGIQTGAPGNMPIHS